VHYIYIVAHVKTRSLPHLESGYWYFDCVKEFCPTKEEAIQSEIDTHDANALDSASGKINEVKMHGEDDYLDLLYLDDKERKKFLPRRLKRCGQILLRNRKWKK
jgi:hypothetical protein